MFGGRLSVVCLAVEWAGREREVIAKAAVTALPPHLEAVPSADS